MLKSKNLLSTILLICLLIVSCKKDEPSSQEKLTTISIYPFLIPETSGLSAFVGNDRFLTVSDTTGMVYVVSSTGKLEKTLPFEGGNLEGVCFDSDSIQIFVVDEKLNEVICLDTLGNEKYRFEVSVERLFEKHGLEGIALSRKDDRFFVVNEQFPGRLYRLNFEGGKVDSTDLAFASDYSGLSYDALNDQLWILSDQSKTLHRCNLKGESLQSWETGVTDGEGLVVKSDIRRVYISTDSQSAVYVFSY